MQRFYLILKREIKLQWENCNQFLAALFFCCFLIFIAGFAYQKSSEPLNPTQISAIFWVIMLISGQLAILQLSFRTHESEQELLLLPINPLLKFTTRFIAVYVSAILATILASIIFSTFFNLAISANGFLSLIFLLFFTMSAQTAVGLLTARFAELSTSKIRIIGLIISIPLLFPVFASAVVITAGIFDSNSDIFEITVMNEFLVIIAFNLIYFVLNIIFEEIQA